LRFGLENQRFLNLTDFQEFSISAAAATVSTPATAIAAGTAAVAPGSATITTRTAAAATAAVSAAATAIASGTAAAPAAAIAAPALAQAGLAGFHDRDPATLSGGQKVRAALMRTLLAEPRAVLLDEPFARLDAGLRADIRAFTFDHARQMGIPVLLVTHDAEDAQAAAGPVVELLAAEQFPSGFRR